MDFVSTHVQDMATAYEAADNQEDKEKAEDGNATDDTEDDYCINATPAQWQRGADAAAEAENRAGAAGEVEIEVEEFEYNDVMYLLDPAAQKVYTRNGDNEFVGGMFGNEIDFDAADSAEDADEDPSGLSAVTGQMQDARNEAEDGDDTDVGGSSVFFNRDV